MKAQFGFVDSENQFVPEREYECGNDSDSINDALASAFAGETVRFVEGETVKLSITTDDKAPHHIHVLPNGDTMVFRVLPDGSMMQETQVTVRQWLVYLDNYGYANLAEIPEEWNRARLARLNPQLPMVFINVDDCRRFCEWACLDIPTEKEWTYAATGGDNRIHPWGNEPPTDDRLVWSGGEFPYRNGPEPVGSRPKGASRFGCVDMAGNAWEWNVG